MNARPAFYALAQGSWRDYVTLLHPPYTLWHLSYVAIGAGLAPELHRGWLVATLAAFFLALGVAAHALDELHGRPLRTEIPSWVLVALAALSLLAAVAIGLAAAVARTPWLLPFIAFGAAFVVAYNLELFGGAFHGDLWFALVWGGFPLLTGYFTMAERIAPEAVLAAGFACASSLAQRRLSTAVRRMRRRVAHVRGTVTLADGREEPVTTETVTEAPEAALRALTVASVLLAAALVTARL